jgi:hypothetical protein
MSWSDGKRLFDDNDDSNGNKTTTTTTTTTNVRTTVSATSSSIQFFPNKKLMHHWQPFNYTFTSLFIELCI